MTSDEIATSTTTSIKFATPRSGRLRSRTSFESLTLTTRVPHFRIFCVSCISDAEAFAAQLLEMISVPAVLLLPDPRKIDDRYKRKSVTRRQ